MLPYAALHQLLEPPDRGGVRARVVQHDDGPVLDVVQPPLGRDVTAKEDHVRVAQVPFFYVTKFSSSSC